MKLLLTAFVRSALALFLCANSLGQNSSTSQAANLQSHGGVIVEKLADFSEGRHSGLSEGDLLVRWSRGDSSGGLDSPFDLITLENEESPKGTVTLDGFHGAEKRRWSLGQDRWVIQTRPNRNQDFQQSGSATQPGSADPVLAAWFNLDRALADGQAKDWQNADREFRDALDVSRSAAPRIQAIILRSWAETFVQRNDWKRAKQAYEQALDRANSEDEDLSRALLLGDLGELFFKQGDSAKAEQFDQQALELQTRLAPDTLALAATLNNLGKIAEDRSDLDVAESFHQRALEIARKIAPGSLAEAAALRYLGIVAFDHGDLTKSEAYHQKSLVIRQKIIPGSLDIAASLTSLGSIAWYRDDLLQAEKNYRQAFEIRQQIAPDSLDVAASLSGLGLVAWRQGNLARAGELISQALAIRRALAPDSAITAVSLMNLEAIVTDQGDLPRAEKYGLEALILQQELAPKSLEIGENYGELALVARLRGDFTKSERYYARALAIWEKLAPESLNVATYHDNLGDMAQSRGDLDRAEQYYRRGLLIRQHLAPKSLAIAHTYTGLGVIAQSRGDLVEAAKDYLLALSIRQELAPQSLDVAESLNLLGILALRQGDLFLAAQRCQKALELHQQIAPRSPDTSDDLNCLGETSLVAGRLDEAEGYYERSDEILRDVAPATIARAQALGQLAFIAERQGRPYEAARFFEQSLQSLEGQIVHLGGSEQTHAGFRASYETYYQDYISLLIEQGDTSRAFEIAERSRARTLVEMLAHAHVDIHKGADPVLLDQERALRQTIAAKSDLRVRLLSSKNARQQVDAVDQEIAAFREQYQSIQAQLRAASSSYAALTQPQIFSAAEIQILLDPDTVLLEYSLGEKHSYVFAVTRNSIVVRNLPARAEIEGAARQAYDALTTPNRQVKPERPFERQLRLAEKKYELLANELSRMVLLPVAEIISGKRLLVVSDGALQYIPFAALPEPASVGGSGPNGGLPLIVEHEVVNLPSASVVAFLREQQKHRRPALKAVAVIADPVFSVRDGRVSPKAHGRSASQTRSAFPAATPDSPVESNWLVRDDLLTRSVRDVGLFDLSRLLFTRREADAIISLAPRGQSKEALDFNATRATATSPELSQYRIVHFATHGLLDSQHPELSGLVLSLVDEHGQGRNGFLTLDDIYNLDLPADLVVLSACETGLGKEIRGEGLIGLTRGFMYAGASRVVASLWSVSDVATAELMRRFYSGMLRDHLPPAAALRRAQSQMSQQTRWKSPYYWAAFQIQGDWQ